MNHDKFLYRVLGVLLVIYVAFLATELWRIAA